MDRIRAGFSNGTVASHDSSVLSLRSSLQNNGSWNDINYGSTAQTNWQPGNHFVRISTLSRAYSRPESSFYGNDTLRQQIINTLQYWLTLSPAPTSTNWFYLSISVPKDIGTILIAMRYSPVPLPALLDSSLISWMTKGTPITQSPAKDGSNLTDVAQHYIMRACLTQNQSLLNQAVTATSNSILVSSGEGIQSDHSYRAHGAQLYLYGYGREYISGISNIAAYVTGTGYAFSSEKMVLFSNMVRNGFMKVSRGGFTDFNVYNRSISRPNAGRADSSLIRKVQAIDLAQYYNYYEQTLNRMNGNQPPSYMVSPENVHYWRSDYMVHHRASFLFSVRAVSTRTVKAEMGNGENIKGYYLSDGANFIAVNGDEYFNIYPVWEWNKIPGTTVPEITTYPVRSSWGTNPGTASFVGAVSNGQYGASAFAMNDYTTQAKKAWFFFDREVVCLGTGIISTASQPINTTLNQCLLNGSVNIKTSSGESTLTIGNHSFNGNLKWVYHNNVGYYLHTSGNLQLSNQSQSGTQKSINTGYSDELITKDVFKLWWKHGTQPVNNSYAYSILPGTSLTNLQQYDTSVIQIISNSPSIQAVYHDSLHQLQAVFHQADSLQFNGVKIKTGQACILLLTNIHSNTIQVSIADPTQLLQQAWLAVENPALGTMRQFQSSLPENLEAGGSVQGEINLSSMVYTPPTNSPVLATIIANADAFVRDGSYANTNYPNGNLVIKTDGSGYSRKAFLQFDLSNFSGSVDSAFLRLYITNANTTVQTTNWEIHEITNNNWTETGVTWNNQPVAGQLITTLPGQSAGNTLLIPVTSLIHSTLAGSKKWGIRISSTAIGSTTDAQFGSRENATSHYQPALLLHGREGQYQYQYDTLVVARDSWIRSGAGSADKNFGAAGYLAIRNNSTDHQIPYLQFDRRGEIGRTMKAHLQVFATASDTSIQYLLYQLNTNNWLEGTGNYQGANNSVIGAITWNNAPIAGNLVQTATQISANQFIRFSLNPNDLVMSGDSALSFRIISSKNIYASLVSRQAGNSSQYPSLIRLMEKPTGQLNAAAAVNPLMESPRSLTANPGSIRFFPNPARQQITIQANYPIQQIRLFSNTGQLVKQQNGNLSGQQTINLQALPAGIYNLQVSGKKENNIRKIMILPQRLP
ncbi:polysaccharide lyase family 8 super-sandwich domain-containing protein [Flavihumibacter sp. UBA7668]|uniref:polysaccharide lyase family 8 super-sandwich domain-containing protein n=1 Tax=Flavihumibacter sp. UBA7668 TaxID=1946542 RepID=UPI0025BE91DD|nr:polysaccharide lyase family 8 super-sandwich domain-containing protein [Flavihumibacter sp. UBA7668]